MLQEDPEDIIENFYEKPKVKELLQKTKNPNFKDHHIAVNSRIIICGASGTGKTNILSNLMNKWTNTFSHIHLCARDLHEPLYEHIQNEFSPKDLTCYTSVQAMPNLDDIDKEPEDQHLVIFDDQISDKKSMGSKLADYMIRGRKKMLTQVFISQSYTEIPTLDRKQMTYLILLRITDETDLKFILRKYRYGISMDTLLSMYNTSTKNPMDFFKIDCLNLNKNERYSKNFKSFFKIDDIQEEEKINNEKKKRKKKQ
jgi:predicted ATPase